MVIISLNYGWLSERPKRGINFTIYKVNRDFNNKVKYNKLQHNNV